MTNTLTSSSREVRRRTPPPKRLTKTSTAGKDHPTFLKKLRRPPWRSGYPPRPEIAARAGQTPDVPRGHAFPPASDTLCFAEVCAGYRAEADP
jgi:hypothetical protein